MREVDPDVLVATEVRSRLFAALDPLVRGVVRATSEADVLGRLRVYVRPFPLPGETPGPRLFLVLVNADIETEVNADIETEAGRELTSGLVRDMPSADQLEQTINDVLAIALSSIGHAAEDVFELQEAGRAQLLLVARPADGSVKVLMVPNGGRPVVLGALLDAPETVH